MANQDERTDDGCCWRARQNSPAHYINSKLTTVNIPLMKVGWGLGRQGTWSVGPLTQPTEGKPWLHNSCLHSSRVPHQLLPLYSDTHLTLAPGVTCPHVKLMEPLSPHCLGSRQHRPAAGEVKCTMVLPLKVYCHLDLVNVAKCK